MGRLYQRGRIWWIQYYAQGQLLRETSRSSLKSAAAALLKKREGDIVDGRVPNVRATKTTFDELVGLYRQDLAVNERATALIRARAAIAHLAEPFSGFLASQITTDRINAYILTRRSAGATNGTVNRELSVLRRVFRLAVQQTPPLVHSLPAIPHLREDNVRKGFFTDQAYQVLRSALPDYLQVPFEIGYWTGMRAGEILGLRWDQINLDEGWLRLEPGTTKTGRGRIVPLAQEVRAVLDQWRAHTLRHAPACPWVCHYYGSRLRKIPKRTWRRICQQVGLPGRLFHDLRRTAVRNMVLAGVSERVAMEISGHRTRSVFNRYNIVSESDLFDAITRVEKSKRLRPMSTISSTEPSPEGMPDAGSS